MAETTENAAPESVAETKAEQPKETKKEETPITLTSAQLKDRLDRAKAQARKEAEQMFYNSLSEEHGIFPEELSDALAKAKRYDEERTKREQEEAERQRAIAMQKGDYDKLESQLRQQIESYKSEAQKAKEEGEKRLLEERQLRHNTIINNELRDAFYTHKGLPDGVVEALDSMKNYGVRVGDDVWKISVENETVTVVDSKGGQALEHGDPVKVEQFVERFLERKPYLRQPSGSGGSGLTPLNTAKGQVSKQALLDKIEEFRKQGGASEKEIKELFAQIGQAKVI